MTGWRHVPKVNALTAHVFNRATNSLLKDGFTSRNFESAFLHDASGVVPNAITQFARVVGISGDLIKNSNWTMRFQVVSASMQVRSNLLAFHPYRIDHRYRNLVREWKSLAGQKCSRRHWSHWNHPWKSTKWLKRIRPSTLEEAMWYSSKALLALQCTKRNS